MTQSVIQPGLFPKNFCVIDITVVQIDLNILSSVSLSLIIVSAFECE